MSRYCPEIACEFWEEFPDGYTGKKSKICLFCRKDLITERPVNPRQQKFEEILVDPIGEADENITECVSKEIADNYTIIEQPSLHNSLAKVHFLKNTKSDIATSFEETTTITTGDNSDKNTSDPNPIITAKEQPSDGKGDDISDTTKSNPNPIIVAKAQPSDGKGDDISDTTKSNPNPIIVAKERPSDGKGDDISDTTKFNPNPNIVAKEQPSDGKGDDISDTTKFNPNPNIVAKEQPSDGKGDDISDTTKSNLNPIIVAKERPSDGKGDDISDTTKFNPNPNIVAKEQPSDGKGDDISDTTKSNRNPIIVAKERPSDGKGDDISDTTEFNPNPNIVAKEQPSDGKGDDISDTTKSNPNPIIVAKEQPSDGKGDDISDTTKSNPNPIIVAKEQPSDGEKEKISGKSKTINSGRDPLVDQPSPVSDRMHTNSANNPCSTNNDPNQGKNKRSNVQRSEADDKDSEVRKSKRIEQTEGAESQHAPLSKYPILSEINPKDIEYVNIQFDTLILKEYWKKIDAICLRIGGRYFDDFKTSIVHFSNTGVVKLKGCEFVTITGILKFPIKLIRINEISFSYKYYVYSNDKKESYEHLHHYSGTDFNRYFIWNIEKYPITSIYNNTYHKFDMMILPELHKKGSTFWGYVNTAYSYLGWADKDIPFKNITDRRLVSLQAFLPTYMARGFTQPCQDLGQFLATLTNYVNSLMYFRIQEIRSTDFRFWEYNNDSVAHSLLKIIEVWIKGICDHNIPLDPKCKVQMFYIGCYLIHYYKLNTYNLDMELIPLVEGSVIAILKDQSYMLGHSTSGEFTIQMHSSILEYIFNNVMKSKHFKKLLLLIPLYHGISNLQEHSMTLHKELKYEVNEYWGFPTDVTIYWQDYIHFDSKNLQKALTLTQYDPILPYTIAIYSLNEDNAKKLCEHFIKHSQSCPLSALMSVLLFRLSVTSKNTTNHYTSKDNKLRTEVMKSLNTIFTKKEVLLDLEDIDRLTKLTLTLALKLPTQYFDKEQFNLCLNLICQGLIYWDIHSKDTSLISFEDLRELFYVFVGNWYQDRVIKTKSIILYRDYLEEIKFWEGIITKYPFPQRTKWFDILESFLAHRYSGVDIKQQFIVDLFIHLHEKGKHSSLLQELFLKELTSRLQRVQPGDKNAVVKQLFESLSNTGQLQKVTNIFSNILLEEEANFTKNPINHLLSWKSWDTYFDLVDIGDANNIIRQEAKRLLNTALAKFNWLLEQIYNLSITPVYLALIVDNREYFLTLTTVCHQQKALEHPNEEILDKFESCVTLYKWVVEQINLLAYFHDFLEMLHGINFKIISDFLAHDFEKKGIKEICNQSKTSFALINFPEMNDIILFPQFECICKNSTLLRTSKIILKIFETIMNDKSNLLQDQFNMNIFYKEIWIPASDFSVQVLENLSTESILISDMCKYFDSSKDIVTIAQDLDNLYNGCIEYQKDHTQQNKPIPHTCADKINLYFQLQNCSEAASLITQLKHALNIVSNFDIIEDMINIKQAYQTKQLKEVNDKVSAVAMNLGQLSISNLEVIRAIIDRVEFIIWVRSNLKNLNELKTFIDISLTTCGGNPVDIDRITCLSSVCTNFAPLIFQIDENTNYEILIARCKQVIECVERNKELTKLLREVGENVKFWEEMKQSHGSVEETTLMQLDNIIKSGVFCVKVGDSLNLSDIVSLSVDRENDEKRIYTLDQLREFHSKVMLVVSKSEQPGINTQTNSYENSQLFTHKLDTITVIATFVIKLSESGNQNFLEYQLYSDFQEPEDSLGETKQKLTSTLDGWSNKVEKSRNTHYFLNYYTMSQIVALQNGIKSFIDNNNEAELQQLYHLLGILNHEVTGECIQQALEVVDICTKRSTSFRSSLKTKQDFSKQSLSEVISTHYSHIGPAKPRNIPLSNSFSISDDTGKVEFPDQLSISERDLAKEVSETSVLPLKLAIDGIIEMKKNEYFNITEQSLLEWCIEHEVETDTTSIDEVSVVESETESFPLSSSTDKQVHVDTLIDFYQLSRVLEEVFHSCGNKMRAERQLPYNMKSGTPNLVVLPSCEILEFVISLYMSDTDKLPLPCYHEVLICTGHTKLEEIDIFWRRALLIPEKLNLYLFCIIGIENLPYDVAATAVSRLKCHQQKQSINESGSGYKLVLVCSEEKEEFSYMAAAFEDCKIPILTRSKSGDVKRYINQKVSPLLRRANYQNRESAWEVDKERSRVRLVVSDSVGAGKSLYIRNLKSDMLSQGIVNEDELEQAAVTVAIHSKQASEEHLTEQLLSRNISGVEHGIMFHVDIASTVQFGIESILFKLLILGGICKSNGELWHCRQRDYYAIEMTLTSVQSTSSQFCRLFPNVQCVQPLDALETSANIHTQTIDLIELRSERYQRVTAYLRRMETGENLDNFIFQQSDEIDRIGHIDCLKLSLKNCRTKQPSWAEVRNFTSFLDKQLSDCDNSDYCQSGVMGQEWKGFKSFVVKFMLHMSRDFATPALGFQSDENPNDLTKYEIVNERRWENNSHPYIFFNPDGHTLTFLGFHVSNQGHLLDSDSPSVVIENNIMQPKLFEILTTNKVLLQEKYNQLSKIEKVMKIGGVMDMQWIADPDPGYVLTLDNMRKILAILMRFRCNIPVVIMGETGCGKTRLIQFMCSLQALQTGANNMLILKVHGGTTERDVIRKVEEAEKLAKHNFHNHNIDTVLFFDEANTSPAIGLIKEIMCDRRMYGRHISSDIRLQFIAACNPYRRHTKEMLHKLSTAGLGFFTKSTDTTDRLGDIPLRELVYRVMELPASMRPLVWDFGQLSNDIEKTYTREIVAKHLRDKNSPIEARDDVVDAISEVLAGAQNYMRERKDECSFVSLRDVERAMRVMLWFYSILHHFETEPNDLISDDVEDLEPGVLPDKRINGINYTTYSLILSLAVCYRARLQERVEFDRRIVKLIKPPLTPIHNHEIIHKEVERCQDIIIDEMTVGANIARNNALKENVFMMFVCIELKIPLFVIGKPGSSKSLAKSIISNSMQGNRCPDGNILQNFKQIQIMSYQCSQLSTADGIIGVFKSCRTLQRKTGSNKFTACVVLDEVGLAEDSPLLPLKVLHPLLEDNDYGSDEIEKVVEQDEIISKHIPTAMTEEEKSKVETDDMMDRVAFIGISNWSLDPAKMNRGIMVARGDPDIDELVASARGICESKFDKGPIQKSIDKRIEFLAKAYHQLTSSKDQTKEGETRDYFGLRDFYSLVKMLVFICKENDTVLTRSILHHAVKRNFGGVSDVDPVEIFDEVVKLPIGGRKGPDSSPLGLIKANLTNLTRSFHGETRYLLLLTENYAALNILVRSPDMWPEHQNIQDIRVIFGSSFPSDQEYSAVCRNINRIKVCMESGKTIILLNLENLYESLYDALNQYYMEMNNQRYVDLGLGTHRMKCRVHNEFKLIVVADTETVRKRFPTPLINRLEKHFLTMSTVLSDTGVYISKQLAEWANGFSTLDKNQTFGYQKRGNFTVGDCFIGFHDDTPPSIVFHVMKEMYPDDSTSDTEVDTTAVLERCQTLLLRMATTDAVLRVKNSLLSFQSDNIIAEYFKLHLSSLEEYLRHVLSSTCNEITGSHLTQATTHSRLLTDRDVDQLKQRLSTDTDTDRIEITSLSLQQFQTELQYTREIQRFLRGESGIERREGSHKKILLIQCERGAENAKLIACARHKTVDELKDWREEKREFNFEVCLIFLIQLSREVHGSKFVSFCGGEWNTVHIDDIRSLDYTEMPPVSQLIGKQLYELFTDINKVNFVVILTLDDDDARHILL